MSAAAPVGGAPATQYPRPSGPPPTGPGYGGGGGDAVGGGGTGGYAHDHHLDDAFDATPFDDVNSPAYHAQQSPYYQPETRPPPPSGPAPAYARAMARSFPNSLRPALLVTCFLSVFYLLLMGISSFRVAGGSGISGKLKVFEIVQGVLFMVALAVELLGLYAAYTQRLPLARLYSMLSLVAYGTVLASHIIGVVVVYTLKSDVIASCISYYTTGSGSSDAWLYGSTGVSQDGTQMSQGDATKYCDSLWSRSRTWDIVWLFIAATLGALFVMLSFAFAHQLADPSSVRIRVQDQQQRPQHQWVAPPYDPEGAYRYPPGPNNPYAYPPPPPMYQGRPSMDRYDVDHKDPTGAFARHTSSSTDGPAAAATDNRTGSGRSVRRDSAETLRGDATSMTKGSATGHTRANDDEDDGTPQI